MDTPTARPALWQRRVTRGLNRTVLVHARDGSPATVSAVVSFAESTFGVVELSDCPALRAGEVFHFDLSLIHEPGTARCGCASHGPNEAPAT